MVKMQSTFAIPDEIKSLINKYSKVHWQGTMALRFQENSPMPIGSYIVAQAVDNSWRGMIITNDKVFIACYRELLSKNCQHHCKDLESAVIFMITGRI